MASVLVVTSGRADGCPLSPVIRALAAVDIKVNKKPVGGWPAGDITFAIHHNQADADLILLLGDRYETLAAALGATLARKPIAHIHGGETSWGSFDNQLRDAITKLSHVHFVAHEKAANRLFHRLSESRERIHIVGAPGLDNLGELRPRTPTKTFVCTYHPCTAVEENIAPLLEALDRFPDYEQIWTGVNNDPGSDTVARALDDRPHRDLAPGKYLALCRQAAVVVGNSSSGLIEAPSLEVPTVNVGQRQAGRVRGPSVLDAEMEVEDICRAIDEALNYTGPFDNPYKGYKTSSTIAGIISRLDLDGLRVKRW